MSITKQINMKTEYIITFVIVIAAMAAFAFLAPKLGLSSYEEYYEEV